MYDNREIGDNNHPSVYLFNAEDSGIPNQQIVTGDSNEISRGRGRGRGRGTTRTSTGRGRARGGLNFTAPVGAVASCSSFH